MYVIFVPFIVGAIGYNSDVSRVGIVGGDGDWNGALMRSRGSTISGERGGEIFLPSVKEDRVLRVVVEQWDFEVATTNEGGRG